MRQPIKRHGGKHYLAKKIVELMPTRARNPNAPASEDFGWVHYIEPYFGGGSVLFAMEPDGISEVVNDIDGSLTNFWRVLQDEHTFEEFKRQLQATPCSQQHFLDCQVRSPGGDPVEWAVAFFVVNRQSRQGLGKDFATLVRNRTRRGMNELASAWLSAIEGLPEVHERLQRVVILQGDALKIIRQQDGPRTLFYLDPPYLHETRSVTDAYDHEMTDEQHKAMLEILSGIKGRFLLSGYRSKLYDSYAERHGWRRIDTEIDNKSGNGKTKQKRVECVWMNYTEDVTAPAETAAFSVGGTTGLATFF